MLRSGTSLSRGLLLSRISALHRRAIRPLGVGASVGADCSRRPGIDRYRATATAPDCVLWQHGARGADTQRNSLPLVTDQKVGGSNPSGRALLRQTTRPLSSGNAAWGPLSYRIARREISRCEPYRRLRLGSSSSGQPCVGASWLCEPSDRSGRTIRGPAVVGFGTRQHDMAAGHLMSDRCGVPVTRNGQTVVRACGDRLPHPAQPRDAREWR